ncbi:FBD-associated F-box protein At5g22730-like isoform X1 [Papaver somniferum]|uniref:FBD-associated F-box protein At5g22730-like isoform X1 n=1 Tax=Papaver somniferum TaxID=3469 RepID=UPI000E70031D|nr:FBD-associated F-box protein At5g22730-like isoform X1 [Papaver somniferum]
MKVSCVSVASLKHLFITSPARNSWNLKINLYSPNLQSLTYTGMPEDFVLTGHGFSSLVDVDIDMPFESMNIYTKRGKERLRGLKNLAEGILNVKLLKISGDPIVYLYFEDVLAECTFQNLRQLEVSLKLSCGTTEGLFYLLFKVPNLESIIFSQGFTEFLLNVTPYNEVPECLLLQLKAVKFREIYGHGVELDVITFFLKNSLVLQTMTITFSSSLPQCWRDIVIRTILMSPKGAANGVINFL